MDLFWEKSHWEKSDKHLAALASLPFRRRFPFIPKKKGAYLIRGPRQIGKSSWLKTILSDRVRAGKKCFYLSCETVSDFKDLTEILKSIRNFQVVLLDEISFVTEWWRAVKHELDRDSFEILVLTGSHQTDIRKGMDQMPGRWGNGGEFHLLPMEFDEFSQMRKEAGWPVLERLEEIKLFFKIGGFPIALVEAGPSGRFPSNAIETFRRWLVGDILKLNRQESFLKEILLEIAQTMTTPLSLNKLAARTQLSSHHTVQEYLQILEDCFALRTLYSIEPGSGKPQFKKEKKFYFRDPLIYWLAFLWSQTDPPLDYEPAIAEMVAHESLRRKFERMGFVRSQQGEIDFVAPKKWAIEVKWSPVAQNLSATYKNLRIPQKMVWTYNNFLLELPIAPVQK